MVRTLFVSGGSRGIGRGILETMAGADMDVAFTYHSQAKEAEELAESLSKRGGKVFFCQASMQEADVPKQTMQWAIRALGHLDIVVCNAGMTVHNALLSLTEEEIDFCYRLDYRSYILCAKEAILHMTEQNISGRILFITSSRGTRAYPEDPLYGGMKAAVSRACESLALECARTGITVNCIAPGHTIIRGDTDDMSNRRKSRLQRKIPVGFSGSPSEVGKLVRYLSSVEAQSITGCTMRIDGGLILPAMPEDNSSDAGAGWHILPEHLRQ